MPKKILKSGAIKIENYVFTCQHTLTFHQRLFNRSVWDNFQIPFPTSIFLLPIRHNLLGFLKNTCRMLPNREVRDRSN